MGVVQNRRLIAVERIRQRHAFVPLCAKQESTQKTTPPPPPPHQRRRRRRSSFCGCHATTTNQPSRVFFSKKIPRHAFTTTTFNQRAIGLRYAVDGGGGGGAPRQSGSVDDDDAGYGRWFQQQHKCQDSCDQMFSFDKRASPPRHIHLVGKRTKDVIGCILDTIFIPDCNNHPRLK